MYLHVHICTLQKSPVLWDKYDETKRKKALIGIIITFLNFFSF